MGKLSHCLATNNVVPHSISKSLPAKECSSQRYAAVQNTDVTASASYTQQSTQKPRQLASPPFVL